MENWTNLDKGREGVKNPGNFADIICTWPLNNNRVGSTCCKLYICELGQIVLKMITNKENFRNTLCKIL